MAYREYSINALADIPAIVAAFATEVGWNVFDGDTLRHPNYEGNGPGGLAFKLTTNIDGLNHFLRWECVTAGFTDKRATIRSPIYSTVAAPAVATTQIPTKLFLISMLTPEPYIAIVVEYGYNLYRHLYLGFMEKIGNYSGGEVIGASNGYYGTLSTSRDWWEDDYHQYLFTCNQGIWTEAASGGVHIDHADNASPWRHFKRKADIDTTGNWTNWLAGNEAFGGFMDSFNDFYPQKGKNSLAGANVLSPISLFATQLVTGDIRFIPIGNPAGVRLINIEELEAQAVAEVGGETWYTFACHRKSSDLYDRHPGGGSNNRYPISETSYYLGYAYRGA